MSVKISAYLAGALTLGAAQLALADPITVTYKYNASGYTGEQDTYVAASSSGVTNQGYMYATVITAAAETYNTGKRALVTFGNLNLPANVKITKATLQLYVFSADDSSDKDGKVTVPISTMLRPYSAREATWTNATASTVWATPGAGATTSEYKFDAGFDRTTPQGSVAINVTNFTAGYVDIDVTASLQAQYDAGKFYGWMLGGTAAGNNDGTVGFRDTEFDYGSAAPVLTITYEVVPEPKSLGLLGAVAGGWWARRR